ncbi:hypothetical protein LUX57_03215 [Actinomadura madurae]|nr:hypothetical protein [Actinomadura madurae]MCP9964306.1 hypothetical protein [Actinomadura madurae]
MLFEPLSPEERHLFRDMLLRILAHHDERFTGALEPPGQQTGTGVPSRSRASS